MPQRSLFDIESDITQHQTALARLWAERRDVLNDEKRVAKDAKKATLLAEQRRLAASRAAAPHLASRAALRDRETERATYWEREELASAETEYLRFVDDSEQEAADRLGISVYQVRTIRGRQ